MPLLAFATGLLSCITALSSCSTTSSIPDDDQLFTGLTQIAYRGDTAQTRENSLHIAAMKEELEAALATTPNGALFGSSYYRSPLPIGLWIWNAYSQKTSRFAQWMTRSFGRQPVLMSQVNPALRASVARSVLKNYGYFRGDVSFEAVPQKNKKKSKIGYAIRLDSLFTYDSIAYTGFPEAMRQLIDSTQEEALITKNSPFSISSLEAERNRIATLLRNNGYYYFYPSYTSYLADTFATENKAQLRFQLASDLPEEALQRWYIGTTSIQLQHSMLEQPTDSTIRRHLRIYFKGKHSPIRPRVVLRGLRLRPRQLFSYANYLESANNINATGVFSSVDFRFTPRKRDSLSHEKDTMDLRLVCTFDKPYDFYVETNLIGRTVGRYGPEVKLGFTRRNAFRGAEKLDVNLHGSYEWQRSGGSDNSTYQYGADASLEFPRIIAPFFGERSYANRGANGTRTAPRRRRFYATPTTLAKVSSDVVRRPGYYKMHIVSGEWTYRWQPSAQSRHEFSPLTLKYQFRNSHTEKFDSILIANPYLSATMDDYFVPKMRYTYTYTSPASSLNPIRWETTIEESGNATALWDLAGGHSWNEKDKKLFKNPYAQFIRVETDFTKTWSLGQSRFFVGHLNAGAIRCFGNSSSAPFSETFYAGGANSIRAFTVRSVGPGSFAGIPGNKQFNYLMQNGDLKFVGNLEYRTRLFGNLHGAVFLDAGNIWTWDDLQIDVDGDTDDDTRLISDLLNQWLTGTKFRFSKLFDQTALGTGIGLRYDMDFLVIRIDWGLALHAPYDTGKKGYFNINRFKDAHTLHFAIGYPF